MSEFDFTNAEEALQNLRNQLKKNEQAYARKALSEALGIDFDKLAALIEDDSVKQTAEKTDNANKQAEPESDTDLLRNDAFSAQDLNGLHDVYLAEELNIGAVVSIGGMEVFHILDCAHGDQASTAWVDPMGRVMSDQVMARLAQDVNTANEMTVVKIIHLG